MLFLLTVVEGWVGGGSGCISVTRTSKYLFFFTKNNLVNAHVVFLSHCTSDLLANAIMLQFLKRWGKETSSFLR